MLPNRGETLKPESQVPPSHLTAAVLSVSAACRRTACYTSLLSSLTSTPANATTPPRDPPTTQTFQAKAITTPTITLTIFKTSTIPQNPHLQLGCKTHRQPPTYIDNLKPTTSSPPPFLNGILLYYFSLLVSLY